MYLEIFSALTPTVVFAILQVASRLDLDEMQNRYIIILVSI